MTPREIHHAQIMIECGCTIEDVAVTMGMTLAETIHVVAPALRANPREMKRVRRVVLRYQLPFPEGLRATSSGYPQNTNITPVIHSISRSRRRRRIRNVEARTAA